MNQDRSSWLLLLFVLAGVIAPTGSVLFFMNEAARSEAESARQGVTEAYRGQLRLLRNRVDLWWKSHAAAMEEKAGDGSAADFPATLEAAGADTVFLLGRDGSARYPAITSAMPVDTVFERADWQAAVELEGRGRLADAAATYARLAKSEKDPSLAARAAQARIRCQLRSGQKAEALASIQQFLAAPVSLGTGLDGRLIAADEQLLALHLMNPADRRYLPAAQRLAGLLNRYDGPAMPSAQRLFLMDELRSLVPAIPAFRLQEAERLAALFLENERPRPGESALEPSGQRDIWKLTSAHGRVIALYRSATVISAVGRLLEQENPSRSVRFAVSPGGGANADEAIAAGSMMPGWQISFTPLDSRALDAAASGRMRTYLWIGYFVIAALAVTGLIVGQSFRRQVRLARLRTDLVAAVSHELRTPLASIRLLVDTMREERLDSTTGRAYLDLIAGENLRLTRLIDNFLTFSRIERNRQRFEFAKTNPADVVQGALLAMSERLQAPGCQLTVDVTPGLPPVYADEDALVTVLRNLLDNAYKYTPREKRIGLRAYRETGRVIFVVEDNGIGIAPREQKRIFRRFYQVDRRLARETGGCGLGLSIVQFIVRAHGGAVKVRSQSGAGSEFSVWLPCGHEAKA